nr:zinc finger protein 205-like [Rhipicephalus microplus]
MSDEAIVASVVEGSPNDSDEDEMESDNTGDPDPTVAEAVHCAHVMRVFAEKRALAEKLTHSISIPLASTKGPEQSLGPGTGSPAKALRHQCRFCPYATQHRGSLVLHERVHTGERPFRCHLCSRGFAHRSHLVCHYRTHTRERPYQCPLCPAAFSQRSNVKVHLRTHRLHVTSS